VGTVRFIDRALNLIQLDDGTELRTTDARMLQNIKEGMQVLVDFTNDGTRNEINSIAPVGAGSRQVDVSPTTATDLPPTPGRLVGGPRGSGPESGRASSILPSHDRSEGEDSQRSAHRDDRASGRDAVFGVAEPGR